MNVLSLFDGLSGGHIALDRAFINIDNYYASEVDKYAIEITQKNYPNTIQLGDVSKVSYKKGILHTENGDFNVGKIDMIIGGSPCFVGNTLVLTKNGYKEIKDIRIGDFVLSHDNKYHEVTNVMNQGIKNIYEINAMNFDKILTTLNHKFFVRKKSFKNKQRIFDEPIWLTIEQLLAFDENGIPNYKNYYVGSSINQDCKIPKWEGITININQYAKKHINTLDLNDENFWYIVGRYLGDGWLIKNRKGKYRNNINGFKICCGKSELEELKNKIDSKYHYSVVEERTVYKLSFTNSEMGCFLAQFGEGAANKFLPGFVFDLPINLLTKMIEGYIDSDGCYEKNNDYIHITSVSKLLIYGIAQCINKVYKVPSAVRLHKTKDTKIIEGRIVNQKDFYTVKFKKNKCKQDKAFYENEYIWYPIKSIKKLDETKEVFDISVSEANSFMANNCIVHNCQSFTFAGKRDGMSTEDKIEITTLKDYLDYKKKGFKFSGQSYLFWEYVRILKEVKPTYFFLENVKMETKWKDIITKAVGIESININSNLLSAQNRDRLYWTNINNGEIPIPNKSDLVLKDILIPEMNDKYPLSLTHYNAFMKSYPNWKHCPIDKKSKPLLATYYKQPPHCPYIPSNKSESGYRRLSPVECERLQTLPDDYTKGVSDTQRYKMIGNGWTIDVISYIFSFIENYEHFKSLLEFYQKSLGNSNLEEFSMYMDLKLLKQKSFIDTYNYKINYKKLKEDCIRDLSGINDELKDFLGSLND